MLWAAFLFFIAAPLPTLGFVMTYYSPDSTVADRYVYLSVFGLALAGAAAVHWAMRPPASALRRAVLGGVVAFLLFCGVRAGLQSFTWMNSAVLLVSDLDVQPNSQQSLFNLPFLYVRQGRLDEAEGTYRRLLQINPDFDNARVQYANLLERLGRYDDAEEQLVTVLRRTPTFVAAAVPLARLLRNTGREPIADDLIANLPTVRRAAHKEADDLCTRAQTAMWAGRPNDAETDIQRALLLDPHSDRAWAISDQLDAKASTSPTSSAGGGG